MPGDGDLHVEIDGVSKAYGQGFALGPMTLGIGRGEMFSLLGPSGSGKTTLLHLIAGLLRPDSGRIRIAGQDVTNVPVQRRNVGVVFQGHALFPHMTVARNIAYGLEVRRWSKAAIDARVDELLRLVRLGGMQSRYPRSLSGGEQQRVALARALAFEPTVLLLDEPFSNLDRQLKTELRSELKRIQRETGVTSVFVTHDQEEAFAVADNVAVFSGGRLEQAGAPHEVYDQPRTEFVARFLGRCTFLPLSVDEAGRLRLGTVEVSIGADDQANARVATIRPERVRIGEREPLGEFSFPGVVAEVIDEGPGQLFRVGTEVGDVLSYCLNGMGCEFGVGDTAIVHWDRPDMKIAAWT